MYLELERIAGKRRKYDTDFTVTGLLSMTRAVVKNKEREIVLVCIPG